ncbi:acetyl-CoA hydrolase/transferase family protein [Edaphosphingomonas haloaromaticamans]|uniref:Uncharacterized protein n=1 Tax=Edaphosphingomonas haloaromaticamans TaxID=653954 RepID=A0A1S1HFH4_9SPHN|nr:acetyl-CoA hydrolase/transferase C-terminal domain-containing protein [Sphingomonas haloaromaticamans]OHT19260.1 hypothetical protein BHE75_01244 [Sphingomonas haloaromaticamans]
MASEFEAAYREKLLSAKAAAALIPSGAKLAMGMGVSQPPALLAALARRAEQGLAGDIRLYYLLSTAIAGETVLREELADRIQPYSLFHGPVERAIDRRAAEAGRRGVRFIPTSFQQVPRLMCDEVGVDSLVCTVSPMDAEGWFSFGTNTDYAKPVADRVGRVIVEVNPHMPRTFGDSRLHVSQVAAIVEHAAPLIEAPRAALRPEDRAIGALIAGLVEDGATLQLGIGAVPDAVCEALAGHRDLGLHTEMLTPGPVELMRRGAITNARKTLHPGKGIFTFSMGDRTTYDFIDGNPDLEAYPVSYVNDPAVIARNAKMVSINATLQVDLTGACCSEFLDGRQYTAAGGQLDFVRGASASPGGRSIIACHATAARGTASRIVPRLDGPVTTPRNDVHHIVTEHGVANLRGLTSEERACALIAIAAPQFREELARAAREQGLIFG